MTKYIFLMLAQFQMAEAAKAQSSNAFAQCTLATHSEYTQFDFFGPVANRPAMVLIRSNLGPQSIQTPANIGFIALKTYRIAFDVQGSKAVIQFPNDTHVSRGTLTKNGITNSLNCRLKTLGVHGPESPSDYCYGKCGRSCFARPVFCGSW